MKKSALSVLAGLALLAQAHSAETTSNSPPKAIIPDNPLSLKLDTACEKGDLNKIKELLASGAPLNGKSGKFQCTPLHFAATHSVEILKYLVGSGADINATDRYGSTPLSYACFYEKNEDALALLDAGANPNLARTDGKTPLMYAADKGNDLIVQALLSHHANVNASGGKACAPIWWAVTKDRLTTAKLLLDAGANPSLSSNDPADPLNTGPALLGWATVKNDAALMDLLLAHGVNINGKTALGITPLMRAIISAPLEMVDYLLDKNPDVNLQDDRGETALMYAILYNQSPTWQKILDHGAKLEAQDKRGRTVLMHACINDYPPAITFLLDHGAQAQTPDLMGNTALTYAANKGDGAMVALLREKGLSRSDIHIIIRPKPVSPQPSSRSWALAVGAIYAQHNGDDPDVLGYDDARPVDQILQRMTVDWGVTDRASFLQTIANLRDDGYRAEIRTMPEISFDFVLLISRLVQFLDRQPDRTDLIKAIRDNYFTSGPQPGPAGDLCRYANLVNQGYAAHYLQGNEAWDLLMANAQQAQITFHSWKEMSDQFLDDRGIWAGERDPSYEACAQLLTNPKDANSPWNQNPWQTPLAPP